MKAWPIFLLLSGNFGGTAGRQLFRKEPSNRTSVEGEASVLECEVEAPSGPVQWVKDGLLLGPDRTLPGFPRYSLIGDKDTGVFNLQIVRVKLADEGAYQCQVGRSGISAGIISGTAWLEVLVPPRMPRFLELFTGDAPTWVAGKEYSLTCEARDSKPESGIIFNKNGVELSGADTTVSQGSNEKVFSTVSIVRFIAENSDNGKKMVCSADNLALDRPRTTHFTMIVLFPPQKPKVKGYDGQQVKAGATLELTCISTGGNPLPTLQWLKGDQVLSRNWNVDDRKGSVQSVLAYHVTAEDNEVTLACEVTNLITAQPLRAEVTLHVVFPPETVLILGSPWAREGDDISLSCHTSSSNPAASVRWWSSGQELNVTEVTYLEAAHSGVTTMSNVTFIAQRWLDGTSLVCEAVNEAAITTVSASVLISVTYPPERIWIQAPPEDVPFLVGTPVTLTCFASGGSPLAALSWTKDSVHVPVTGYRTLGRLAAAELVIATEPSDNQAEYRCLTSSADANGVLSAHTRIAVQFAPLSLGIVPPISEICEGDNVTLVCRAGSSNPAVEISWIKHGVRLPGEETRMERAEFGGWSSETSITLAISAVDNGQRLECRAQSAILREAMNTFHTLDVRHAPRFLADQVGVVEGVERGAVEIPLRITANPREVTYTWSHRGQVLVKEGPTRHHLKTDGSLEIWNLTRYDAGIYKISVQNKEGEIENFIQLSMLYSPRIYSISDPAEVEVGGSVEMVCTVDANPVRNKMVQWFWTGQGREVNEGDQVFAGNTTTLVIEGAMRGDAGRYECRADNGIPPTVTANAQLVVQFSPDLRKDVEFRKVAVVGDGSRSAVLRCKAEGVPDVEFTWAKNGVTLDPDHPRYSQRTVHEGPLHSAELTVSNASAPLDFATFSCTARNALGADIFDIQLLSTGPPDPPSDLTLVRKSHNSVTLAWNSGFNGGLEQTFRVRYVEWDARSFLYADVYPSHATSFTVTGLRPGTTYNFSVNAINALGASEYAGSGVPLTLSTSGQSPFPTDSVLTPELRAGGLTLPLTILIPVMILLGSLLILNLGILARILWKMRAGVSSGTRTGKSKSAGDLELNDYVEKVEDITSDKLLFLDTSPEPSTSTYESYYCSSQSNQTGHWSHGLLPTGTIQPRFFQEAGSAASPPFLVPEDVIYEDVSEEPSLLRESTEYRPSRWANMFPESVRHTGTRKEAVGRVRSDRAPGLVDYLEAQGDLV